MPVADADDRTVRQPFAHEPRQYTWLRGESLTTIDGQPPLAFAAPVPMDNSFAILIFIVFAVLVIVAGYFSYQAQQRRMAELGQLAAGRGWRFDSAKDHSHDERYGHFSIFTQGSARYAYNTIGGTLRVEDQSWPLQLGDYRYQTTSHDGKRTRTHTHTLSYILLETPYLGLPELFIRSEGFFDKVAGFLGFDDIDFESAEFSDRFVVKSRDKRFAYDVLHPRMMEFLLDGVPPTIEFRRGQCCFTLGEKCWSVAEFEAVLDWIPEFFALWPRHVTSPTADRIETPSQEGRREST